MTKMYWTVCDCCGIKIQKKLAEKNKYKHKFCSLECSYKFRRKRLKLTCANCGKEVIRYPSALEPNVFCSHSCSASYSNRNRTGKRHPNFVDGKSGYRERAMSHYGSKCMNPKCELTNAGISIPENLLDVHHVDGNRKNNKIVNLIVLCVWCHTKITRKLDTIENMMKGKGSERTNTV